MGVWLNQYTVQINRHIRYCLFFRITPKDEERESQRSLDTDPFRLPNGICGRKYRIGNRIRKNNPCARK